MAASQCFVYHLLSQRACVISSKQAQLASLLGKPLSRDLVAQETSGVMYGQPAARFDDLTNSYQQNMAGYMGGPFLQPATEQRACPGASSSLPPIVMKVRGAHSAHGVAAVLHGAFVRPPGLAILRRAKLFVQARPRCWL
jgi:hypothetical protein